jgi:VWFA-related protein
MKLLTSTLLFCLFLVVKTSAQTAAPAPTPTPTSAADGDIVKITTTLIQVDVTVLDKKGNQVTNLTPEDFVILENGKRQKISNFSYVAVSSETRADAEKNAAQRKASRIPPVPVKLKPEQVRRTIVLLVDDLGLTFNSMFWVREALKNFVNNQMQPEDLVAIMRTGSGVGALQQFTSDKRLLLGAIAKIKWNSTGRGGLSFFEPVRPTTADLMNGQQRGGKTINIEGNDRDKENKKKSDEIRNKIFTGGTLGTIRNVVAGLESMPGRKAIIVFSDGIAVYQDIFDRMKLLVDAANRAGVVINTIDAKGMSDSFLGAEDDTKGLSFEKIEELEQQRADTSRNMQMGLDFLAYETGGRPIRNNGDLKGAIRNILQGDNGYYLIGYVPDEDTFDPKTHKYNKLEVKVARENVSVRHRSGFFGVDDIRMKESTQTPQEKMRAALTSPFGSKDIETRLTSVFGTDAKIGDYSRALLHIDTNALEFTDGADGNKTVSLDIYAYVFGADGKPQSYLSKNYTFAVRADSIPRLHRAGITFPMNVPIEKPGAYQLRMAVRDTKSGKIGSASQFIEIPNLKKDELALSGIVFQNMTVAQLKARQDLGTAQALTDTATRTFKRGTILVYNYAIYNAKTAPGTGVQLQTHARLFRDGKLVYESAPQPVNTAGQTDLAHIEDRGVLTIGNDLAPGDYVLQIVTTDNLAKEKNQIAAQSIDFEVVE